MPHRCRRSDKQYVQPFLSGKGSWEELENWLAAEEESIARTHLCDLSDLEIQVSFQFK